jgi:hypothetical protein
LGNIYQISCCRELAFDEDDEAEIENRLVTIRCKNLKVLQFQFCNSLEANEFERKLLAQCFDSEPFALVNRNYMISDSDPDLCNGWKLFSWEKEFQRMQVPADQWRITTINKDFSLSPTYPPCFIIPKATSDQGKKISKRSKKFANLSIKFYKSIKIWQNRNSTNSFIS